MWSWCRSVLVSSGSFLRIDQSSIRTQLPGRASMLSVWRVARRSQMWLAAALAYLEERLVSNKRWMLSVCGLVAAVLLASAAYAQVADHLKCYRIKGAATFSSATADLASLRPHFPDDNCRIRARATELCVPASKTLVSLEEGAGQRLPGEALVDAQLCYKLKCPKAAIAPVAVSDQFGTRVVEKFRATKICGPAIEQP